MSAPTAGGTVSIFDQETKIQYDPWCRQKRNTKFSNDLLFVKYKLKEIQSYSHVTLTCIPSVLSREKEKQ